MNTSTNLQESEPRRTYGLSAPIEVLLIEDNAIDSRLIHRMLGESSTLFHVATEARLVDGVTALRDREPDVVLLDLSLPDAAASHTFERIHREAPHLPVVIVTALDDQSMALQAVETGAQDYLIKGEFDSHTLARSLRYAIERQRLALALRARAEQQAAVALLGQRAVLGNDLTGLMEEAVQQVARTLAVDRCEVLELGAGGGELASRRLHDTDASERAGGCTPCGTGTPAGLTLALREPVIVEDLTADPRFGGAALRQAGLVSGLCVSIPCGDRPYGVLSAFTRRPRQFTQDDTHFLNAVANVIGSAILRTRSAEALRQSEAQFRSLIEKVTDLTSILNPDGAILYTSPSVEQELGHRPQELAGKKLLDFVHPEDQPRVGKALRRLIEDPSFHPFEVFRFQHSSGAWRTLETIGSNLLGEPAVRGLVVNSRDVTRRQIAEDRQRKLEDQLRQAQKMEAIGRLAGGVAHDFNNIITAIIFCAESLREALRDDVGLRNKAEEIQRSGVRAGSLTRQLLAFSRQQVLQPKVIALNEVVTDMESMLRRVIGEDIELRSQLGRDAGRVAADPSQLQQVILNLAINARDAMPNGGRLRLTTRGAEIDAGATATAGLLEPGTYVELEVADDGVGMTEEVRSRVFEPFFTTKPAGKGTGLGLSTVYGIVRQSGGTVVVESAPGEGTTFRIYLPRVEAEVEDEARAVPTVVPGGTETLLLVEDENDVRSALAEALRRRGYRVFEAANGRQALELLDGDGVEVDLLVTDVVMPEMRGTELARILAERGSEVPVLYITGYAGEGLACRGDFHPGRPFLQKPFSYEELATKIRDVLAAAGRQESEESAGQDAPPTSVGGVADTSGSCDESRPLQAEEE